MDKAEWSNSAASETGMTVLDTRDGIRTRTLKLSVVIMKHFSWKNSVANSCKLFCSSVLHVSRNAATSSARRRVLMLDMSSSGKSVIRAILPESILRAMGKRVSAYLRCTKQDQEPS